MIYSPAQKKTLGSRDSAYTPGPGGLVSQMRSNSNSGHTPPLPTSPRPVGPSAKGPGGWLGAGQFGQPNKAHDPAKLGQIPGMALPPEGTTPPAGPPPPDYWADAQAAFQGVMADDEKSWQGQQQMLQRQMDQYMVQSDSMNARMGGSLAGGSAGLAGAALGQGMRAYNDAAQDYANRRRQTQLAWLDQQIEHGQRQEEHGWALNDPMTLAALQQMIYQETGEVPSDAAMDHVQQGGGYGQASNKRSDYYADYMAHGVGNEMVSMTPADRQKVNELYALWQQTHDDQLLMQIEKLIESNGGDFVRYSEQK
jgi:hypothetical protein